MDKLVVKKNKVILEIAENEILQNFLSRMTAQEKA